MSGKGTLAKGCKKGSASPMVRNVGKTGPTGGETFYGLIYQVGGSTGNLLIKSWKVKEKFGQEAMLPAKMNSVGAVLGDKVSFEIAQGRQGGRPLAVNVKVRGHIDQIVQDQPSPATGGPSHVALRRQVLYYVSDENLRHDKFFQDIIASSEGGWINMSHILGCKRMQQMGATVESILGALSNAPEVELRDGPAGQEALRRKQPPPTLDSSGPKPAKGQGKSVAKSTNGTTSSPSREDLFFAGTVANQQRREPYKFFITCDEITSRYGLDAFFLPEQKPSNAAVGSLVVFTVAPDGEVGFSPQCTFIAALAPLGSLGNAEADAGAAPGESPSSRPIRPLNRGASGGLGVQKTITKRANSYGQRGTPLVT